MSAHDRNQALSASQLDAIICAIEKGPEVREVLDIRALPTSSGEIVIAAHIGVPHNKALRDVTADIARVAQRVRETDASVVHVVLEPEIFVEPRSTEPPTEAFVFKSSD